MSPKAHVNPGIDDLATVRPDLATQWHPELNDDLTPDQIRASYRIGVWWLCEQSHAWSESPSARRSRETAARGCPVCSGVWTRPGVNDLATTNPEAAMLWDFEGNGLLTPADVLAVAGVTPQGGAQIRVSVRSEALTLDPAGRWRLHQLIGDQAKWDGIDRSWRPVYSAADAVWLLQSTRRLG